MGCFSKRFEEKKGVKVEGSDEETHKKLRQAEEELKVNREKLMRRYVRFIADAEKDEIKAEEFYVKGSKMAEALGFHDEAEELVKIAQQEGLHYHFINRIANRFRKEGKKGY